MKNFYQQTNLGSTLLIGCLLLCATLGTYFIVQSNEKEVLQANLLPAEEIGSFPIVQPTLKYGLVVDTFQVTEGKIESGMYFGDILQDHKMSYLDIEELVKNTEDIFDVSKLRIGKNYMVLASDTAQAADYFIYEPNVYEYIVFDLEKKTAKVEKRKVDVEEKASAGIIETSLWNAMVDNGMSFDLAARMEDALQWSLDFHHIQKADEFKLVYNENYIEGNAVGIGDLHAAYYKTGGDEYYAIYFESEDGKHEGYYDLKGHPMKKGFLRAPLKYARISSRYNLRRFHPVLKRTRPHYGTDYAAPYGTPIYAVGDGVVERANYTKGNGRFVKIRHNDTYQTQYLHMQKFAKGMKVGKHVKQGEVIGYVGSTGLATGPHVCFRFWKNGKQVNHLNLKFPPAKPLPEEYMPQFEELRNQYLAEFDKVIVPELLEDMEENEVEETVSDLGN
ncbi:MAG: peptidoglycan DD-metalloendopeptidase family protein, partial [Bacteroidota bacterium]